MANGVSAKHADYIKYSAKWQRCRDVFSGQDAIYAGRYAYLPLLTDEQISDYNARQMRTPFYNASWRTVAGFIGMLYRKPPTIEVPKGVETLLEDVTMSGVTFNSFVQDCTLEDLEVSRLGVLVDYPQNNQILTKAQAERAGLRPSMVQYKAEAIINWKYSRVNNKTVLTQVRLAESETVELSEFETKEVDRYRVLDLVEVTPNSGEFIYRIRIYDEDENQIGYEYFPVMNNKHLDFIPFYFIGPDGSESKIDDPILIDLVDLNLKHFLVSADYEHGCHMTGLPTPVITGWQDNSFDAKGAVQPKFYIGSTAAWLLPANCTADFLEFSGTGINAIKDNLEGKQAQMAAIGARMLAPEKSGVEAAETLAMRHNGENSILAAIAIAVSQGLTDALKVFCAWAGYPDTEVKFEISREFIPVIADAQLITQLIALVQSGLLDKESLFDWLKRADLVAPDMTYEIMQGRIDADPPPVPLGHNGGPPLDDPNNDPNAENN